MQQFVRCEQFFKRPMVVLFNIRGKCAGLRAKSVEVSRHLPVRRSQSIDAGVCSDPPKALDLGSKGYSSFAQSSCARRLAPSASTLNSFFCVTFASATS